MKFSIIIPSWNNLEFLKLCISAIRKNSSYPHQIIVHVNEGADGTAEWVKEQEIEFTFTPENAGICRAVNQASELAAADYIVYMNDDMYALPRWDEILADEISKVPGDCFMLSSTMIEPYDTGNACVIVADYGRFAENFNEKKLLEEFSSLNKKDWSGSTWPPALVHRKWWEKVGGYSEEFSPGMSSDDDFAMKMWAEGCRFFKGVSASRVYHFVSKSTGRVVRNNGRIQFLKKWGIKQSMFHRFYLHRGEPYAGALKDPPFTFPYFAESVLARIQKQLS